MQFEGGATATLQMVAFTERLCARVVTFQGTKVCTNVFSCNSGNVREQCILNSVEHKIYPAHKC